jgi:hypothetical protein
VQDLSLSLRHSQTNPTAVVQIHCCCSPPEEAEVLCLGLRAANLCQVFHCDLAAATCAPLVHQHHTETVQGCLEPATALCGARGFEAWATLKKQTRACEHEYMDMYAEDA